MAQVEQGGFEIPWDWPEVAGIFVGGCIERGVGSSFRAQAHAHTSKQDEHRGWICVRSGKRVTTDSGKPTTLMLHEYAHIITGQGHTAKWAEVLTRLGAPAEAKRCRDRYAKRHRHEWTDWWENGTNMRHRKCLTCDMHMGQFIPEVTSA